MEVDTKLVPGTPKLVVPVMLVPEGWYLADRLNEPPPAYVPEPVTLPASGSVTITSSVSVSDRPVLSVTVNVTV